MLEIILGPCWFHTVSIGLDTIRVWNRDFNKSISLSGNVHYNPMCLSSSIFLSFYWIICAVAALLLKDKLSNLFLYD